MLKKVLRFLFLVFFALALGYAGVAYYLNARFPHTHWNWATIDTNDVTFSKDFLWGTATAAHQIEGGNENSNWGEWEKLPMRIKDGSNSSIAVDHRRLFRDDIRLMKELGVNSYRFSLAWNKIQPDIDTFSEDALKFYDEVIDECLRQGIAPMITLHHFTHPLWFERLGAFEKEENIHYFTEFSRFVFSRYSDRVRLWITFNEPNVFVTNGYFNASFPPGKSDAKLAAEVLENMLRSHVLVYRELKKIDVDLAAKDVRVRRTNPTHIGLATSVFQFEPARRWHLGDWAIARISSDAFNESVLGFFRNGTMKFFVPLEVDVSYTDAEAPNTLDFVGINYYSHYAFKFDLDFKKAAQSLPVADEEMTDMPYTIYTEGIYRAIQEVSNLRKPIIITENGIADSRDDRREKYIRESLYAVSAAIRDGFDVRGYYYWTLMDNFEWSEGYTKNFGLYEVDLATQKRTLRKGAGAFVETIARMPPNNSQ